VNSGEDSTLMPSMVFNTILDSLMYATRGQSARLRSKHESNGGTAERVVVSVEALESADHVQVLCTGSLILIGNILGLLDPDVCDRCTKKK